MQVPEARRSAGTSERQPHDVEVGHSLSGGVLDERSGVDFPENRRPHPLGRSITHNLPRSHLKTSMQGHGGQTMTRTRSASEVPRGSEGTSRDFVLQRKMVGFL
jgi:hypothetical protein